MNFSQFDGDRIIFPGNPWPNGHGIVEFEWFWTISLEGDLHSQIHLRSEKYYANDSDLFNNDEADGETDWTSRSVWENYKRCTLSSTFWGHGGFQLGSTFSPFDFRKLDDVRFTPDALPFATDSDEPGFGIYCLGHDTVAQGNRI